MAGQKNYFGKGSIQPKLPGVKAPRNPADPVISAKNSLKSLENSATSSQETPTDKSTAELERSVVPSPNTPDSSSLYSPTSPAKNKSQKPKSSRLLRRLSPVLLIVFIVIIGFFVIFGSSSFLGPHIEALFTEATDTGYTGYNLRAQYLAEEMLSGKLEMTDYFKSRLEKEGITVKSNSELSFQDQTITASNFRTVYNGNAYFREAYDNAIQGRGANFFDDAAQNFYQKLGLSRDVFHEYKTTGNNATDTNNYNSLMSDYFRNSATSSADTAEKKVVTDEEGNTSVEYIPTGGAVSSSSAAADSSEDRAKAYLRSLGEKVAEESAGCSTLKIGNLVSTAVSSSRYYQTIHDFMTKIENISKAKYGNGDDSAVNSVLNWFTTSTTATVYDPVTGEESTVVGSPLESDGMSMVLSGIPASKTSTEKYSLERSYVATNNSAFSMGLNTSTCDIARTSGVVISLSALARPGISLVSTTVGALIGAALDIGIKVSAETVLSLLVPTIANIMFDNPFDNANSLAGGETFTIGAANANMLLARQTYGASTASKEQILSYNQATESLIAREAEVDRINRSPLDISSKNTFLGSIASSLLPLSSHYSTLGSMLSSLSSTTSTSLASLSSTYAASENSSLLTSFGDCEKAEEIGASANLYCSAISTIDLSIISTATDDPEYQAVISESVEVNDTGEEVVLDGSPLADYITFHMGRYSAPGIRDANIAKACKDRARSLPHLTSITSMLQAFGSDYCESVADGSRYVNSPDNPYWETEKWHQLWVLTWRIKCHMGLCPEDGGPVVAYQSLYEKSHPLDNSRSGYLARISGLDQEDAETVIALSDYLQKITTYNPNLAYQFSSPSYQPLSTFSLSTPQQPQPYSSNPHAVLSRTPTIALSKHEETTL